MEQGRPSSRLEGPRVLPRFGANSAHSCLSTAEIYSSSSRFYTLYTGLGLREVEAGTEGVLEKIRRERRTKETKKRRNSE